VDIRHGKKRFTHTTSQEKRREMDNYIFNKKKKEIEKEIKLLKEEKKNY
jgi:hypothetical protein